MEAGSRSYLTKFKKECQSTAAVMRRTKMGLKAQKENEYAQYQSALERAVEAGEKLGFLPGDLQQKVDPYLRPLYDALYQIMGAEQFQKNMEKGLIEVAPLAYMRGRTLSNAFIILDEAQNATESQIKMFLTRMGRNAKFFITGDITQIDLPKHQKSGLVNAGRVLKGVKGIDFIYMDNGDVVRHQLVTKIIQRYEQWEEAKSKEVDAGEDK